MNNDFCNKWMDVLEKNNPDRYSSAKNNPFSFAPYVRFPAIPYIREIRINSGVSIRDILDSNRRNKDIIMKRVENKRKQKRTCKKI